MKRLGSEVVGSLFWLAVGVFFAVGGIMLKPGTLRNPGPGLLPLIMSLLLISFSLFVLAKGLIGPEGILKGIQWKSQTVVVASVFLYGLLLNLLGFLLSTFALMFVLYGLFFGGKNKWPRVFFCATATALAGWLVFSVALKVPFPKGWLIVAGR
ncbi:MAG TPA: tripartite tricarboxylate transporter TctB family protein [Syntrophorhabdales bacterium]|nr:tripartite tricarboxylate transporter TctB family protein [Syntrophorhabdales bacterium]